MRRGGTGAAHAEAISVVFLFLFIKMTENVCVFLKEVST